MTDHDTPEVTVFIPLFNRERCIGSVVESVLGQSFSDVEVLVVDESSNDGTCGVVESYRDPRIRLVRNESNMGILRTRNGGFELARCHLSGAGLLRGAQRPVDMGLPADRGCASLRYVVPILAIALVSCFGRAPQTPPHEASLSGYA